MNSQRRDVLGRGAALIGLMASAGLLPQTALAAWNKAAFDAKSLADVVKALGGANPTESKDVVLSAADIAENGAVVPVVTSTNLSGVKSLSVLVEKNPSALAATYMISDAIEANITTRVKMGQSSNVYAVAVMNDGKVLYAVKEIKVTLGGCGG